MIIAGVSDLHGKLTHSIPECDVLAIVGDITPLWSSAEQWQSQRELDWAKTKFIRWVKRQPAKHVIIVPGNHDLLFWDPMTRDEAAEFFHDQGIHVLGMQRGPLAVEVEHILFAGNPWTPTIQNRTWAFSASRRSATQGLYLDELDREVMELNNGPIDVLLSHGPPQGLLDFGNDIHERYGCAQLMYWMLSAGPRITLTGHIHEQRGNRMRWFDNYGIQNKIINVSICDENYTEQGAKVQTVEVLPLQNAWT